MYTLWMSYRNDCVKQALCRLLCKHSIIIVIGRDSVLQKQINAQLTTLLLRFNNANANALE